MGDAIVHRGPDGEGFHVETGLPTVGLVSRRLAVIDVAHGAQPMSIAGGDYTIVYNGEVFNADELRRELEGAGERFITRCDTEVVVRGYAAWGADVLQRLNGMWAFAIWDRPARRLFLARDRLGVKPLVYAQTSDGFVFGSEIKALLASGLVRRALDPAAIPHYLATFAVPDPMTLLHGVRRLPAAHWLIADAGGGVREHEYWDCALEEDDDRGADAFAEEVGELLGDAVRRRLASDVPLGVLLSGGVDSRLVAAYAARDAGSPLRTFTLGFDGGLADERVEAQVVAEALGSEHHEDVLTGDGAAALLPDLIAAYDEPGQSLVQTHAVSRFAAREVTVALSGIGGDELFAAYPTHVVANLLARVDALPGALRTTALLAARAAPNARVRRAGQLAAMPPRDRIARALMDLTPAPLRSALLSEDIRAEVDLDAPARRLEAIYDRARGRDELNRLLYVYIKSYLPDELLRATDAMSMANSLEIRTPLLDYRLVELAMRTPARHKLRLRRGKLVLRALDDGLAVPSSGVKRGFSPPVGAWLRGPLREQARDALSADSVRRRGVFDPARADEVLKRAFAGDERMIAPTMMLFAFETWARRGLDARDAVR